MKNRFLTSVIVVAGLIAFGAPGSLFASSPSHLPGYALDNGDINGDWQRDLADPIYLLSFLFRDGPAPAPLAYCGGDLPAVENGDVNGDGYIDIGDPVGFLGWFFKDGAEPALACGMEKAGAGNPNPRVIPPKARPHGLSYGEWGAGWQQWVFTTTTANCPVTDTTGEFALVNQSGHVYFLAGTFGENLGTPWEAPNPVTRNVTIPTGIELCMPLLNWGLIYPDDNPYAGAPPDATWEEAMPYFYGALNAAFDETPEANMACVVDGVVLKKLRNYRAQSAPFMVYAPADNVQSDLMNYYDPDNAPFYTEGNYHSVSDGYYVMLAPLPAGSHTIYLRGGPAESPFCEVTYNLTVGRP